MKIIQRHLFYPVQDLALDRNKMVFISGPRQSGKTTFAKSLLENKKNYFNWDMNHFKKQWTQSADIFAESLLKDPSPRILLDEFHKNPKWKNQLKGFFDSYGDKIQIMVTGSAHLNTYRQGSDSLLGRFYHFHMHGFSLGELTNKSPWSFNDFHQFIQRPDQKMMTSKKESFEITKSLLKFGGFPEPYLAQKEEVHRVWVKNRLELLIRQDLIDVSHLLKNHQVDVLALLLPDKVSSSLSLQSLAEDLDVAYTTVGRWMNALKQVYYHFDLIPYSKNIARSLKKEAKIYLYDWSMVENQGARFENMVACHLKKMIDYYNDTGQSQLSLRYLRDKEKNEVDFLILKKEKPLASFEVKLSELNLNKSFLKFQKKERYPHFQIVLPSDVYRAYQENNAYVISFDKFFYSLP